MTQKNLNLPVQVENLISRLLENTGISKHLYKKYYLNNIDPTNRIGKNGPIPKITISQ